MVDARGLSCPMPVIMTQKAMKSKEDYHDFIVSRGRIHALVSAEEHRKTVHVDT